MGLDQIPNQFMYPSQILQRKSKNLFKSLIFQTSWLKKVNTQLGLHSSICLYFSKQHLKKPKTGPGFSFPKRNEQLQETPLNSKQLLSSFRTIKFPLKQ
jgi:hypothetical protein